MANRLLEDLRTAHFQPSCDELPSYACDPEVSVDLIPEWRRCPSADAGKRFDKVIDLKPFTVLQEVANFTSIFGNSDEFALSATRYRIRHSKSRNVLGLKPH